MLSCPECGLPLTTSAVCSNCGYNIYDREDKLASRIATLRSDLAKAQAEVERLHLEIADHINSILEFRQDLRTEQKETEILNDVVDSCESEIKALKAENERLRSLAIAHKKSNVVSVNKEFLDGLKDSHRRFQSNFEKAQAEVERLRNWILVTVNHINYLEENGVEINGDWEAIRKWLTKALESESEE